MAAPTFVASYSSAYSTTTTPKTLSVTTQAGDVLVVYGGVENGNTDLSSPSGNSISFTLQQSVAINGSWANAYIWAGTDTTGGTNWTLSCTVTDAWQWGFTCLVFRNSDGIGASSAANASSGNPAAAITTTQANSALVAFNADWNVVNGSSRTWNTINSITPTNGNGLERDYAFVSSHWTSYGAYWNDVGASGSKTVGLSAPAGQKWSIVGVEVKGSTPGANTASTAWFVA